jgi:hypothetical protein
MTLSTTVNRVTFSGNDVTTGFSFPYKFNADADLVVILRNDTTKVETTQVITTHYTVSGAGDDAGGTVTMVTAPATGESLTIYRDPALTQETDYVENDPFPAETHEDAVDLLTMLAQRLSDRLDRAITLSEGNTDTSTFDPTLPANVVTAGALIIVKDDLTGFELTTVSNIGDFAFPAGNGIISKTGTLTSVARTITATANETSVTNGDGTAGNPTIGIADDPVMPGTGKMDLPKGTDAQRPGAPAAGQVRYNTDIANFEFRMGGAWIPYLQTRPGFINVGLAAATTTNANDSIKITGADGNALSATNPGYVIIGDTTSGQLVVAQILADVTIDLTGAHYGFGTLGDLTDQQLSVYAIYDGALKWGVAYHSDLDVVRNADDETTQTNVTSFEKVLVNSALTADGAALHRGWFKANFDDTGGAAEDLWAIQTALGDINVGIAPLHASYVRLTGSNGYGSTDTHIRRYTTIEDQRGDDLALTQSSVNGDYVTVNRDGIYSFMIYDNFSSASSYLGLSINTAATTTSVISLASAERLSADTVSTANQLGVATYTGFFRVGDVIRPHTTAQATAAPGRAGFSAARVA